MKFIYLGNILRYLIHLLSGFFDVRSQKFPKAIPYFKNQDYR